MLWLRLLEGRGKKKVAIFRGVARLLTALQSYLNGAKPPGQRWPGVVKEEVRFSFLVSRFL